MLRGSAQLISRQRSTLPFNCLDSFFACFWAGSLMLSATTHIYFLCFTHFFMLNNLSSMKIWRTTAEKCSVKRERERSWAGSQHSFLRTHKKVDFCSRSQTSSFFVCAPCFLIKLFYSPFFHNQQWERNSSSFLSLLPSSSLFDILVIYETEIYFFFLHTHNFFFEEFYFRVKWWRLKEATAAAAAVKRQLNKLQCIQYDVKSFWLKRGMRMKRKWRKKWKEIRESECMKRRRHDWIELKCVREWLNNPKVKEKKVRDGWAGSTLFRFFSIAAAALILLLVCR